MDYRVKITNVPSVEDMVKRKNRANVNGLRFGWSDKLNATVSEPASEAQVRSFRQARGYVIIDAVSGDLISEPDTVQVRTHEDDREAPQPQKQVARDPNDVAVEEFIERYEAATESGRERFNKDELQRALRHLKVQVGPDATKPDLRVMLDEILAERGDRKADA